MCLFVAGVIDPANAEARGADLDQLAGEAVATKPAYGNPTSLAQLVRARVHFFGGACVIDPKRADVATAVSTIDESAYTASLDFYGAYHVPFFATWAVCEHAAWLAARGNRDAAIALLRPFAERAPNRTWLRDWLQAHAQ
jgi:hypothetical protein